MNGCHGKYDNLHEVRATRTRIISVNRGDIAPRAPEPCNASATINTSRVEPRSKAAYTTETLSN
jgi:hypothetical protein